MAELLKYIYNDSFFSTYTEALDKSVSGFDRQSFMCNFPTPHWESLELKQRMAFLATITNAIIPGGFEDKINVILKIISALRSAGVRDQNLEYIFLADIIAENGLDDFSNSVYAIERITAFTSFEFAGRPFFIRYPAEMMEQMLVWTQHPDPNVRRYASEGCRPRLPWGLQLKQFVADPSPIIPILEKLKDDPSEYVRKSVANNLNDISKDHPHIVINFIRKWHGANDKTDKMLRQAARTLLKTGNAEALSLFGNHQHIRFEFSDFSINKKALQIGSELAFSFALCNTDNHTTAFRVEYIIRFMKANGQHSGKIFKIADKFMDAGQKVTFSRQHRFADLTTRKHYPGLHRIAIVINGKEEHSIDFNISL